MSTINVTDADFQAKVLDSELPVLVDFWAEWCGPCRMLGPVLDELAAEHEGEVVVAKLNVDENPASAATYGVTSIPLVLGFQGGEKVAESVGAKPKAQLEKEFAALLG
ncbi:thioredoxin [Micrococcus sp. ACRRV]|uniref:thioredoxin n=1 Tax=Micrococcus sp. ACRRV TaxID=2918203 RepID=UPI001EF1F4F4|nr:thioredoxin [Micrococcus sp. ACRRV]MCG7422054.1 thioredoxin [Micrococcus sp. ACRRV]